MGNRCADHVTPPLSAKVGTTSPTGGGRSVGIVRSRTKATEFSFSLGEALPDAHIANIPSRKTPLLYLIVVHVTPQKASLKIKNKIKLSISFYYFLVTVLGINSVAVTCHTIPSAVRSTQRSS